MPRPTENPPTDANTCVQPGAPWLHLKAQAYQSTIGQLVTNATTGIERDNSAHKGVR